MNSRPEYWKNDPCSFEKKPGQGRYLFPPFKEFFSFIGKATSILKYNRLSIQLRPLSYMRTELNISLPATE
jgi:hypothetical protein